MFKTLQNAFKVKEIRNKIFYTFLMLVVIRLGSQIPVPGMDKNVVSQLFAGISGSDAFNFFSAFTGGSLEQMSLFALGINPYITSSIILQLLTIAIPKLEELQKDGETGKKKIAEITRYITIALALIEGTAIAIGFGRQGVFGADVKGSKFFLAVVITVITLTAGSAVLMWIGERITENGVGNGISIVLAINIISRIPSDMTNLIRTQVIGREAIYAKVLAALVIIAVLIFVVAFVVVLQAAERKIPVQYAKKMQGRKMAGGQSTHIPLKVNTAGVIPVIFASSLMQFPVIISSLFGKQPGDGSGWEKFLKLISSGSWFNNDSLGEFGYTLGYLIYAVLVIAFAYFYTSITFNPIEVANNMKRQGGFVPGIRPGKPTEEYLTKILNNIVFIGATFLLVIATIPLVFSGIFNAQVSFMGTSIIIIVGVIIETLSKIDSMMVVRNYKGFLND